MDSKTFVLIDSSSKSVASIVDEDVQAAMRAEGQTASAAPSVQSNTDTQLVINGIGLCSYVCVLPCSSTDPGQGLPAG